MQRDIKYIVIHCTATPPEAKVSSIQNYWRNTLHWKSPGYHYIIESDGRVKQLADEAQVANGVAGYNSRSIHISYVGGIDRAGKPKDTRTLAQLEAMKQLIKVMKGKYPAAVIQGHRDFPGVRKACPSFAVAEWLKRERI
jgi:N-acetylmuramoyl-L-alanine amidase